MALQIGQLIAGKYRIDQLLGEGGMGSVYVAENIVLKKKVAVKVMSPAFTKVPEAVERFLREGIAASRVSHPAIVEVFDAGEHEGQPWLAMQLLRGESLGERLDREGKLPLEQVREIARGVLSALAAVHAEGIVHRDLKPDNIFLHEEGDGRVQPKVLDFGIAKDTNEQALNKLTATGAVVGTASYLSPEQAKGTAIDHRTDLYSMGVVLFECLSGALPYDAGTLTQLIAKMFTEQPRDLREVAPEVPEEVAAVIATCLAHDPEERYQTAGELLSAFSGGQVQLLAASGMPGALSSPGSPGTLLPTSQPGARAASAVGGGRPISGIEPTAAGTRPGSGSLPGRRASGTVALEEPSVAEPVATAEAAKPPSRMGWILVAGILMAVGTAAAVITGLMLFDDPGSATAAQAHAGQTSAEGGPTSTGTAEGEAARAEGSGGTEGSPAADGEAPAATGDPSRGATGEEAPRAGPAEEGSGAEATGAEATGAEATGAEAADNEEETSHRRGRSRRGRRDATESQEQGGSSAPPSGGAVGLTGGEIGAVVRQHVPQLQRCHQQSATQARGQIEIAWQIDSSGRVQSAQIPRSTIGDSGLQRCVLGVVRGMRFPPPRGGVTVPARYPIAFQ